MLTSRYTFYLTHRNRTEKPPSSAASRFLKCLNVSSRMSYRRKAISYMRRPANAILYFWNDLSCSLSLSMSLIFSGLWYLWGLTWLRLCFAIGIGQVDKCGRYKCLCNSHLIAARNYIFVDVVMYSSYYSMYLFKFCWLYNFLFLIGNSLTNF